MGQNEVYKSVDHLLRHDSGRMVAVLTRIFGFGQIDRIEDAIQEALLKALNNWPYKGIPENSTAWLIQVAKNHLLDQLRRENKSVAFDEEIRQTNRLVEKAEQGLFFDDEISEDQLRTIFACCHPSIPKDSQIALTLKIVGGFNNREIANAFLAKRTAIDKMLVRAKRRLKENRAGFEIPGPDDLEPRLDSVLKVLYLMFNEGYMASEGQHLIKTDLCFEAIRLAKLLASHPLTSLPKVNALVALMMFQGSRLSMRLRDDGIPALLADQDRMAWDRHMIIEGVEYLKASAKGDELTEYHLEAEIASQHAVARSFESTNWKMIFEAYERLYDLRPSPIVALNRAFALGMLMGPEAGLGELRSLHAAELNDYYPFHIVTAEFLAKSGDIASAIESYRRSLELVSTGPITDLIEEKINLLESQSTVVH